MGLFSRRKREYIGEELYVSDESQFERIVAETLGSLGYNGVTLVEEDGFSIKAELRKKQILVKCNFYSHGALVGPGHVRDLARVLTNHRADEAYLVSTSTFSKDASSAATSEESSHRIQLIDGERINLWRKESGLAPILKYERPEDNEYNGEALYIVDPYQFERIVAETIAKMGYEKVSVTRGSGDRGVDVKAVLPLESGIHVSTIFQCKLYSPGNVVGHGHIRDLIGSMMIHEADEAYLITTSSFSQGAHAEVADGFEERIFLVDGEMFNRLRRKAGLAPILYLDVASMYPDDDDAPYSDGKVM